MKMKGNTKPPPAFVSASLNDLRQGAKKYPNGSKKSTFFTGAIIRFDVALENERWYEVNFIPSGFFHDLRDGFNNNEPWDLVQGVTIRQMYLALTPQATNLCNYQHIFKCLNKIKRTFMFL
jgi:hypothetical protein